MSSHKIRNLGNLRFDFVLAHFWIQENTRHSAYVSKLQRQNPFKDFLRIYLMLFWKLIES